MVSWFLHYFLINLIVWLNIFLTLFFPIPLSRLEDTLIDLYLSGYSNLEANAADDMTVFPETDVEFGSNGLF